MRAAQIQPLRDDAHAPLGVPCDKGCEEDGIERHVAGDGDEALADVVAEKGNEPCRAAEIVEEEEGDEGCCRAIAGKARRQEQEYQQGEENLIGRRLDGDEATRGDEEPQHRVLWPAAGSPGRRIRC